MSHAFLLWLAAAIWLLGAIACGQLSSQLLSAAAVAVNKTSLYVALSVSVIVGLLLGATLFRRLAMSNIDRIDALNAPRIWEAYRLRFYVLLVLFDGGSVLLTDYLAKSATSRLAVGSVDLAICVALSVSFPWYVYRFFTDFGSRNTALKDALLTQEGAEEEEGAKSRVPFS